MKTFRKYIFCLLFAAVAAAPAFALAHAVLKSSVPAKDVEVHPAPTEVVLRFNEKLEVAFSSIQVLDSDGRPVSTGKTTLDAADASVMKLAVPALASGRYTVRFVAVGGDGHRRTGAYTFTVK